MYYATQVSVPGAAGNLAAFTPQPVYQAPMPASQNNNVMYVAAPSTPIVTNYGSPTSVGNMADLQKAGVW
jgi:hypothetical protein